MLKVGDRVTIKCKYFSLYEGMEGEINSLDKWDEKRFVVKLDDEDGLFVFDKNELKLRKESE